MWTSKGSVSPNKQIFTRDELRNHKYQCCSRLADIVVDHPQLFIYLSALKAETFDSNHFLSLSCKTSPLLVIVHIMFVSPPPPPQSLTLTDGLFDYITSLCNSVHQIINISCCFVWCVGILYMIFSRPPLLFFFCFVFQFIVLIKAIHLNPFPHVFLCPC